MPAAAVGQPAAGFAAPMPTPSAPAAQPGGCTAAHAVGRRHRMGHGYPGTAGAPPWGQPPVQPSGGGGKPWLWAGVAVAVVVAVAAGLGIVVAQPWRSSAPRPAPTSPPPPADAVELRVLNDGVFVGSSAAAKTIDIFNEPICPPCYHLLNFLDDQSHTTNYSTRAVAASYCVAGQNDPKTYTNFYSALFGSDFQPQEGAASDRTDAELAHLAQTVGANATVISCIKAGSDLGAAQSKATAASETLATFNANGTPFVWDGNKAMDLQNSSWLTRADRMTWAAWI